MKLLLIFLLAGSTAFAQTPEWSRKYHTGSVTCLDFSSDGKKLITGGQDSVALLWSIDLRDTIRTLKRYKSKITNVNYKISDNQCIISPLEFTVDEPTWQGEGAMVYHIIDTTGNILKQILIPTTFEGTSEGTIYYRDIYWKSAIPIKGGKKAVILNSGEWINFNIRRGTSQNGFGGRIDIWDLDSQRIETKIIIKTEQIYGAALAPNEKYIAIGFFQSSLKRLVVYDIDSNKFIHPERQKVKNFTFTQDAKYLLSSGEFDVIYIRTVPNGEIIDSVSTSTSPTTALAADFKNRYYISAHEDSTLRLWTPGIPNVFKRIQLQSPVTTIAVSPDSVRFATGHLDGTVAVWNIDSLAYYAQSDTVFTDVEEENSFKNFQLSAEPNPFKNSTTIHFSLPKSLHIKLAVTDILGREVAVLEDAFKEAGEHSVVFKSGNLSAGMYFYTLSAEDFLKTLPVQIVR